MWRTGGCRFPWASETTLTVLDSLIVSMIGCQQWCVAQVPNCEQFDLCSPCCWKYCYGDDLRIWFEIKLEPQCLTTTGRRFMIILQFSRPVEWLKRYNNSQVSIPGRRWPLWKMLSLSIWRHRHRFCCCCWWFTNRGLRRLVQLQHFLRAKKVSNVNRVGRCALLCGECWALVTL